MSVLSMKGAVQAFAEQYERRTTSTAIDVREHLALADLCIRVVYTFGIMSSHVSGARLRAAPAPGVGTMDALIRGVVRRSQGLHPPLAEVRTMCEDTIHIIDAFRAPGYSSFKDLRDKLSHGAPLPADDGVAAKVADATRTLCADILNAIYRTVGQHKIRIIESSNSSNGERVFMSIAGVDFPLSPLWHSAPSSTTGFGVYSSTSSDSIHYLSSADGRIFSISLQLLSSEQRQYIREHNRPSNEHAQLVHDVVEDIAAFSEDHSRPGYFFGDDEDTGVLIVPWTRPTSDENQPRLDAFRIGTNHQREWQSRSPATSHGRWLPYPSFLRKIANWPLLAKRIAIGLDDFRRARAKEESERLGAGASSDVRGPVRVVEVDGELAPTGGNAFDLSTRIDSACEFIKPSTSVFFLVGDAGLGKTELLLSAALDRARLLNSDSTLDKPLYLFVSSTGRTLASLEDAVNGALNITKLLSGHSARALCRHGLLVLMVDGFDELLGSSGYQNALGSLEPWFRDLAGRGVIVASARSSYYLSQYRRSLSESVGINVDHTLVRLQPWDEGDIREYLRRRDVTDSRLRDLTEKDWRILGVPFFANAFASWCATHAGMGGARPIFKIVVEQYLERESTKLVDPNAGQLLRADELRDLFTEVAEYMHLQKTRDLGTDELALCAQTVLSVDVLDDERPGISRRLGSLCGLGMASSTGPNSRFVFSHEVIFDCFLALAIQRQLGSTETPSIIHRILGAGKIQSSVFDWVTRHDRTGSLVAVRALLGTHQGAVLSPILSENLGAWWMTHFRQDAGTPPTPSARGLRLDAIQLSKSGWSSLDLTNSTIAELDLTCGEGRTVTLNGATIQLLRIANGQAARQTLLGVDAERVCAVIVADSYRDTPGSVRKALEDLEVVPRGIVQVNQDRIDAAHFFLEKTIAHPEVQVVVSAARRLTDDERLKWTHHLGDKQWLDFLNLLDKHNLAHLEKIVASGTSKLRLVFRIPPARIARRETANEDIRAFWTELSG